MEEQQQKDNFSKENKEQFEDFSDFDDDDNQISDIKRDMEALNNITDENKNKNKQKTKKGESDIVQEISKEKTEEEQIEEKMSSYEESLEEDIHSQWEELDKNNAVVKKYLIYIAKDFIPYLDNLSTDERSAYINDAIQMKIDLEDEKKIQNKKRRMLLHLIISIITFFLMTPIALLIANKAILATFENYKYSQDNFEKLYKQKFQKNKTYMRSVQYNKEHKIK